MSRKHGSDSFPTSALDNEKLETYIGEAVSPFERSDWSMLQDVVPASSRVLPKSASNVPALA